MATDAIAVVEASALKRDRGAFGPGDSVRVHVKVIEGEKERVQIFEGVIIRKRGEGARATFTVRRVSYGVGVERTFPIHSPRVERVQVVKSGHVRRSKLGTQREIECLIGCGHWAEGRKLRIPQGMPMVPDQCRRGSKQAGE